MNKKQCLCRRRERSPGYNKSTKRELEYFLDLPDNPGIPYEKQLELRRKSESTKSEEDIENYKKSKESKYRANALTTPLIMGEAYLKRAPEAGDLPQETRAGLLERIKGVVGRINAEKLSGISEGSVDEVVDIVKTIQSFL